jgi:hypothetical protein
VLTFIIFHIFSFYYFGARYLIPIALPLAYIFSISINYIIKNKKYFLLIIIFQITSIITITFVDSQYRWNKIDTDIFEESGRWLKENTNPNINILPLGAPPGAIYYFAERTVVGIEDSSPDMIVESDFWISQISKESVEEKFGLSYFLIKEFSDSKFNVKIYKKEIHNSTNLI